MALRINETRFREMSESQNGPVGRHLQRTGVKAESAAKVLATQEKLVRSGLYRASFLWRLLNAGGLVLKVGNTAPQARLIEMGTDAHRIFPRNKKALWWTHGADRGWLVPDHPLNAVNHPGTRPYMILHRAVAAVLRRGGTT